MKLHKRYSRIQPFFGPIPSLAPSLFSPFGPSSDLAPSLFLKNPPFLLVDSDNLLKVVVDASPKIRLESSQIEQCKKCAFLSNQILKFQIDRNIYLNLITDSI